MNIAQNIKDQGNAKDVAKAVIGGISSLEGRLSQVEQKSARVGHFGPTPHQSWGSQVLESDQVKAMSKLHGSQPATVRVEVKDIFSAPGSGGDLARPSRDSAVELLPRQAPRVRDLLTLLDTASGSVEYVEQTGRDNQAAVAAEGTLKPQTTIDFALRTLNVATIAHWTKASVQVLDDAPQLASIIDQELRYGLQMAEEAQLLFGSGVAPNLTGMVTSASPYSEAFEAATMLDMVGLGILQVSKEHYQPNGIVMHPSDWMRLRLMKNGDGDYILGRPQANTDARLFGLPVVATTAMPENKFLIGDFRHAATLYDRQTPTVALSTEDGDNFTRNMVTIRAEQRVALAIRNPKALSYGDFGNSE